MSFGPEASTSVRAAGRTDGTSGEPSPRTVLARIVTLAAAVRIALELVGITSLLAHRGSVRPASVLTLWARWDAAHHLRIAEVGYRTHGEDALLVVFFPLYPLAVRLVGFVTRDLLLSGLLVSFAASIGAAWLLYRLVQRDHGHRTAWRAVLLFFSFPTAYFLAAPYTESLFLFAVLAAVYAARTRRWPAAAAAGALGTGTRLAGLAVIPAMGAEALGRGQRAVRGLVAAGAASAGFGVYLVVNRVIYGDALHFLGVQRAHWFQRAVPPWEPLVTSVSRLASGVGGDLRLIHGGRLAAAAFAVALLAAGARRLRAADQIYAWSGLLLVLSASWLISLPRYLLGLYPLFVVGALLTRRPPVLLVVVGTFGVGQAYLFWRYAAGAWTF